MVELKVLVKVFSLDANALYVFFFLSRVSIPLLKMLDLLLGRQAFDGLPADLA